MAAGFSDWTFNLPKQAVHHNIGGFDFVAVNRNDKLHNISKVIYQKFGYFDFVRFRGIWVISRYDNFIKVILILGH
jgi:hypothetical protein